MPHPRPLLSLAAALITLALLVPTAGAIAHSTVPWNTCTSTTVCNLTTFPVTLNVQYNLVTVFTFAVPGGACPTFVTGGWNISHVFSSGSNSYTVVPPPPPAVCNCATGEWSAACVRLPPTNNCFDVCFDPATCTITIRASACLSSSCRP